MPAPKSLARFNKRVTNRVLGPPSTLLPGMGAVFHVGRTSGRVYRAPVLVFRDGEDYVIALTYSSDTDWVKNVLAAGGCGFLTRARMRTLADPNVEIDHEKTWAPWLVRKALDRIDAHEIIRLRETG
jgi:deazaflavin-dependent oxidoreductase (nitroreductase family)